MGGLAPVAEKDRIFNLDMLRGWAILGILAVNAIAFAWPSEVMMAGHAPPIPETRADLIGQWVVDTFFADKFRTLFTLLFGVSVFLVGGETRDRRRGPLLTRRLLWLGLIGLIHGALLWYGDILMHYAYCGLIFMLMRSWSAKRLIWIGGPITVLWAVIAVLGYWGMANMPPEMASQMQGGMTATPESIRAAVAAYGDGAFGWLAQNLSDFAIFQLAFMPVFIVITVPLMMLGLGLFKAGYFTGEAPMWAYLAVLVLGGLNLLGLAVLGWQDALAGAEADPTGGVASALGGAAPLITLFYVTILVLITKHGLKPLTGVLAPVGRMAFTNYLTQTLIMMSLYYAPWGPFWFGTQGAAAMWLSVIGIWVLQLIWSPLWLSRFRLGPLEWVWRSLTYGCPVPLRR